MINKNVGRGIAVPANPNVETLNEQYASMNTYQIEYDKLVESHKHLKEDWKPTGSGLERHRIVPGHQGGTYVDSNCTYLTHEQHIRAHWLLWKIHGRKADLDAFNWMKGRKTPAHTGCKHSEETKKIISEKLKGRKRGSMPQSVKDKIAKTNRDRKYRKLSNVARDNMAEGQRRRTKYEVTDEARRNMSKAQIGRKHSEETKRKMKESQRKRRLEEQNAI